MSEEKNVLMNTEALGNFNDDDVISLSEDELDGILSDVNVDINSISLDDDINGDFSLNGNKDIETSDDFIVGDVIPEDEVINKPDLEYDYISQDSLETDDIVTIDSLADELSWDDESVDITEDFQNINTNAGYFDPEPDDMVALSVDEIDNIIDTSNSDSTYSDNIRDFKTNGEIVVIDGNELNRRLGELSIDNDISNIEEDDMISSKINEFTINDTKLEEKIDNDIYSNQVFEEAVDLEEDFTEVDLELDGANDFDEKSYLADELIDDSQVNEDILSIDDLDNEKLDDEFELDATDTKKDDFEIVEEFSDGDILTDNSSEFDTEPALSVEDSIDIDDFDLDILDAETDVEEININDIEKEFKSDGIVLDIPIDDSISIDDVDGIIDDEAISIDLQDNFDIDADSLTIEEDISEKEYSKPLETFSDEIEMQIDHDFSDIDNLNDVSLASDFVSDTNNQLDNDELIMDVSDNFDMDFEEAQTIEDDTLGTSSSNEISGLEQNDFFEEIGENIDNKDVELIDFELEETGKAHDDYDFDLDKQEELAQEISFDEISEDIVSEELIETVSVEPEAIDADIIDDIKPQQIEQKSEGKPSEGMTSISKNDLKDMLLYIDNLFGDLPEDKIKEFAKSKYYDMYNKVFDDLGI